MLPPILSSYCCQLYADDTQCCIVSVKKILTTCDVINADVIQKLLEHTNNRSLSLYLNKSAVTSFGNIIALYNTIVIRIGNK